MRGRKIKHSFKRVNVVFDMSLLTKIDNFLKDPGLKKEKVTRSDFINDIILASFKELNEKGENSLIGREYPEE